MRGRRLWTFLRPPDAPDDVLRLHLSMVRVFCGWYLARVASRLVPTVTPADSRRAP